MTLNEGATVSGSPGRVKILKGKFYAVEASDGILQLYDMFDTAEAAEADAKSYKDRTFKVMTGSELMDAGKPVWDGVGPIKVKKGIDKHTGKPDLSEGALIESLNRVRELAGMKPLSEAQAAQLLED